MNPELQNGATMLRVHGELTIYRAAEMKQALLAHLAGGTVLELDLSGVTDLDTAGLQVLMLLKKTAQAQGGDLRLVRHSPVVVDVLELLGLSAWFGDQIVIPPSSPSYPR